MVTRPLVQQDAERFRTALLARDRALLAEMIRRYQPVMAAVEQDIVRLSNLIARRAAQGIVQTPGSVVRIGQYRAMIAQMRTQLASYTDSVTGLITATQRTNIDRALTEARRLVDGGLPGGLVVADLEALGVQWAVVDQKALETFVGTMRDGSSLSNYLSRQVVPGTLGRVTDTLTAGLLQNPRVTARRLRADMLGGQAQALRVARTETLRAYREATRAQWAANPRLVRGYRRMEALDDRTCVACWYMDGTLYSTDTAMDEHVQGRGYLVPELVNPRELGLPLDPEPRPPAGREVFRGLPVERQRKIINNDRLFKAWKSGAVPDAGLVGRSTHPTFGPSTHQNSALKALSGDHLPELPDLDEFYSPL